MAASGEMAAITRARPLEDVETLDDWIARVNKQRAETGRKAADVAFVPFEATCSPAVTARDSAPRYSRGLTLRRGGRHVDHHEPASRSFTDFCTDIDYAELPVDRPMKGPTVALPDLVLVHGGEHAGDCWDLVVAELRRQEPQLRTLAVDLPGRGRTPGDSRPPPSASGWTLSSPISNGKAWATS